MPKAYVFTVRYQIDKFLEKNVGKWFTIADIARSGEVVPTKSAISYALTQAVHKGTKGRFSITRYKVGRTFYYSWNVNDRFLLSCTCCLAIVVDHHGYISSEDECPVHGFHQA